MKFVCDHCSRMLELERFRLEAGALVVTCGSCGKESRANAPSLYGSTSPVSPARAEPQPAPPPALRTPTAEAVAKATRAAADNPFGVPFGHCPKCISKRLPEAFACPTCGLIFAQADERSFQPSDWLKLEWVKLLNAWGDDSRHEALRAAAMEKGELAEVGRLYRLRLADAPDDSSALKGRDEVLRLAVLPQLTLQRLQGEPSKPPTWKYVALSAVIVGSLIALFLLVRQILTLS